MLLHLINSKNIEQLIIFAKTKSGCDDLESFLRDEGVKTEAIHGDKSQFLRTKIMSRFKEGKVRALVATDIVARGLDISMLPCVINYDLPYAALDYVHRVGRTGRAGNKGIAISIVSKSDVRVLRQIEKAIEHKIPVEVLEGFECDIFKNLHLLVKTRNHQKTIKETIVQIKLESLKMDKNLQNLMVTLKKVAIVKLKVNLAKNQSQENHLILKKSKLRPFNHLVKYFNPN